MSLSRTEPESWNLPVGLGRKVRTPQDMSSAIREGFPYQVVARFLTSLDLSRGELPPSLALSLRTLDRRLKEGRLDSGESDRLYRLARIVTLAEEYLGDHERAVQRLREPNRVLGGVTPLSLTDTELGSRQVEQVLGRIAYGGVS